jgi:hypothetical protein
VWVTIIANGGGHYKNCNEHSNHIKYLHNFLKSPLTSALAEVKQGGLSQLDITKLQHTEALRIQRFKEYGYYAHKNIKTASILVGPNIRDSRASDKLTPRQFNNTKSTNASFLFIHNKPTKSLAATEGLST